MKHQKINILIDACIFFTDEKKSFLKRNFCIYPRQKQERILLMLQKTINISAKSEDFEIFNYGMKMWSSRKRNEILEFEEEKLCL